MSDSELGLVARQSYQMKNPRRLRRPNTRTGCIGSPDWTVQEQALLGTMPDGELAKKLGRTFMAVRVRRNRLRRPNFEAHPFKRWTPEEEALLGTMRDSELAKKLGRTFVAVIVRRDRLRIPCFESRLRRWTPKEDALLGKMRDDTLARKLGRTRGAVAVRRS